MQRYREHLALFLVVILCSCAAAPLRSGSEPAVISGVPFYPQEEYQCGPAALAAVLGYWGIPATPEEISRDIYSRSARGTLSIDMVLYTQGKGLQALHYSGGWDDLTTRVAARHPLIVLVDYGFSVYQRNHFMVVLGVSDEAVVVNSGLNERMVIGRAEFLRTWKRTDFWTLWVRPK